MNGRGSSPNERTFGARATPITRKVVVSARKAWPTGSCFGQNRCAITSLMIATRGTLGPSVALKLRPRRILTPAASKKPESATA